MTERKSLESERAELVALADRIEGNAAQAPEGEGYIFDLYPDDQHMVVTALRSLGAQDQEPVALAHVRLEDDGLFADLEVLDGTNLQPSMSPVALYLSPPPAPGWDEFKPTQEQINSACMSYRHDFGLLYPDAKTSLRAQAREWLYVWQKEYAYVRSSQSTSDTGGGVRVTERLMPLSGINDLDNVCRELGIQDSHVTPAEAVRELKSEIERLKTALSKPAPVAANASAENYRDAIDEALVTRFIGVAKGDAKAELNQIVEWDVAVALDPRVSSSAQALIDSGRNASAEARLRDALAENNALRAANTQLVALLPDPHASDCDKQGETTKSDGSVVADTPSNETATDVMAHPSPMGSRSCDEKTIACGVSGVAPGPSERPSDRPADVTQRELSNFIIERRMNGGGSDDVARALLDAFTVGRR